LGIALARQGNLEEAIDHFRQALQIEPTYANAHYGLGIALAMRGESEEASDHFRSALRTQPEFAAAHEALGRALSLQGKRDEAVQHLEKAIEILKAGSAGTARTTPDRLSPRPESGMESRMK